MNTLHPGESLSLWQDTVTMPKYYRLKQDIDCDVCIIGGGIAGLTTAYLLMKEGKKVTILEAFELGSGQTGRTTAQFVTAVDARYSKIEKTYGRDVARGAAQSHKSAIELVQQIVKDENIDCDMEEVNGYLFAAGPDHKPVIEKEFSATSRVGLFTQYLRRSPIQTFDASPSIFFPNQMQLHPLKYLKGLANYIENHDGCIYTNTQAVEVVGGEDAHVKTADGCIVRCRSIVVATNTPINDLLAIHTKQAPYRTYVMAFKVNKGEIPKAFYWDTLENYHYVRVESRADHDLLIVGGEDHKTGQDSQPELRFDALEDWTRARFPTAGEICYRWSGQIMESIDGLPFLGHNPADKNNVYVITGDSGDGMTHCTIGSMIVRDQILGRENPWEKIYDPSRITFRAAGEFLKENANVAAQYGEWLAARSQPAFEELRRGEGTVFRDGLQMVAVYKDLNDQVEFMSAACTHLGGVVQWNKVESSWDCPCHGARYNCHGKVLEGPAVSDLKKIDTAVYISDDRPEPIADLTGDWNYKIDQILQEYRPGI